jgi:hypothetical protein
VAQLDALLLWLGRALDWPQTIADWLEPVPLWLLVSIFFIPSVIALLARLWSLLLPVLMLNSLIVFAGFSWPSGELRTLTVVMASSAILVLIGVGSRYRARQSALARIEMRLEAMDEQMVKFLHALDLRTMIVEENAIEVAKNRMRQGAGVEITGPGPEPS